MTAKMSNHDMLAQLDAMRAQEKTVRQRNYFEGGANAITEECRGAMVSWVKKTCRALRLSPDTAWIASSFVDRYIASGRGHSGEALASEDHFQLAHVTSFYLAIKIYEPRAMEVEFVEQISQYREREVLAMEAELLSALEWRVAVHTPMDVVRLLLALLSDRLSSPKAEALLESCQWHVDASATDMYFACRAPSVVGVACLASALDASNEWSPAAKQALWSELSDACHFDLHPPEVTAVRGRLLLYTTPCESPTMLADTPMPTRAVGQAKMPIVRSIMGVSDMR